jgi:hypothetical protein
MINTERDIPPLWARILGMTINTESIANLALHDAEITGLSYDSQRVELSLRCNLVGGEVCSLIFSGVKAWRLSEFEDQNVVWAVSELVGAVWRETAEGEDPYYQDVKSTIEANDFVYRLESSVGLDGVIVAAGCRCEKDEPSTPDALPGSKGRKRAPSASELDELK